MPSSGKNGNKKGNWRGGFKRGKERNFNKHGGNKRGKGEYRHQDQPTEEDVGITEYVSKLEGFTAVIKARFSDFQVNEINLQGKMAKLTDISVPKDFASMAHTNSFQDTEKSPLENISQDTWDNLKKLASGTVNDPIELDAEGFTKDERKNIHECIKSYFGQEIAASTIRKDDKSVLQFKKWDSKRKDTRVQWPKNTPEYVHFILYKELMDTMEACFKIGQALKISASKISYAGVKDRRGKTSQWLCIKKYEPSKLIKNTKHIKSLHIGNIEFSEKCLKLGHLKGNRFRIALRNVVAEDELIANSISHLKEHGFINYYGLQRFGNDQEAPTYLIGIKLLLGEWKDAVDLILKVKKADDLSVGTNLAKKVYAETGDAEKAVKLCEVQNNLEKKLLQGLASLHKNDYVNALENIPRTLRLMYIHAYQSLIWNKLASKRIKEFGFQAVEGDLIYPDGLQEEYLLLEESDEEEKEDSEEDKLNDLVEDVAVEPKKPIVRPLTANELDQYSIFDIVLPLPGYDIIYPENVKQFYKEAIEECGLTLEMPKQKVRTYNLSGTYRKLVQRANDLEWKIMYYNDPTDNLIRSDLEELRGEKEPVSKENGKYKALCIAFTLNACSYATMVLREIMKCNTATNVQASLNNYADSNKPKVLIEDNKIPEVKVENQINEVPQGSLLADRAKFEDFKKNLFNDILDNSTKRELEGEANETSSKKLKTECD